MAAEDLTAGELISSLLYEFGKSEFDKVRRILVSREESTTAKLALLESAKVAAELSLRTKITELTEERERSAILELIRLNMEGQAKQAQDRLKHMEKEFHRKEQEMNEEFDKVWRILVSMEKSTTAKLALLESAKMAAELSLRTKITELKEERDRSTILELAKYNMEEQVKQAEDRLKLMEEEFHRKEKEMLTKFAELEAENQVLKRGKCSSLMIPSSDKAFQGNTGVVVEEDSRDEDGVRSKMVSGTGSTEKESTLLLKRKRAAILKPVAIYDVNTGRGRPASPRYNIGQPRTNQVP